MNILRSFLVPAAFVATIGLPVAAFAQAAPAPAPVQPMTGATAPCPNMMREHRPNLMASLNLSPAQKAQLKQIHEQFRAAHPPCGQGATRAQRAQLRQEVLSVLTPQQRAQLQTEQQQEHNGGY